jgi:diguanylate cyclase (GGDEF)-like protein
MRRASRFDRTVVTRLRITALLAIAAVVIVALAQAGTLIYLGTKLPHYDTVVSDSAERAVLVERIVTAPSPVDLNRLDKLERAFNDLSPAEAGTFARFVTSSGRLESKELAEIFEARTKIYVERGEKLRAELVMGVFGGSLVLLLAAIALYVFALVPTVDGVNRTLRSEELQRERLRIVSALSFARGDEVEAEIAETLGFSARSLGAYGAEVALLTDDTLRVAHAYGSATVVGTTTPFSGSVAETILGSHEVLVTDTAIVTTLHVDDVAAGTLIFYLRPSRTRPVGDDDRAFVRIVASFVGNAIERERRESRLNDLAYLDPLTRLPNRAYFTERLHEALSLAKRNGESLAVHFIDLDGFKAVNDKLGHAAGDEVLRIATARMRAAIRDHDVLCRVGGDEFIALQLTTENDESAVHLGERFVAAASEAMIVLGKTTQIGASVGIARYPADADNADDLLAHADSAMYAAKRHGKNAAVSYAPQVGPAA